MPFSFNPGQDQAAQAQAASTPTLNNGVPALNVPVAPSISLTPTAETVSMFAYRNRSKSKFGAYFQFGVFAIFGVMLVSSIGLFGYQNILKLQNSNKESELAKAESTFPKLPLDDMQKLSSRITMINKIVNERASVRAALTVIEESANNPVTYNKFSLSKSKKNSYYDISFGGETNSYSALYQQVQLLGSKTFAGVFPKLTISGIGPLDNKGVASFRVDGSIAIANENPDVFTVIHKANNKDQQSTTTEQTTGSSPDTSKNEGVATTSSKVIQ